MNCYTLHHGDCLDVLRTFADCSVDAVVTDPPYGLSFMGKRWDYDVPSEDIWRECLRVLKPGGHLLAFAGTRTQHRMAVRIEDAGFEIRDMIAWVYGSGFPKSLDVSKAIDKSAGVDREDKFEGAFDRRSGPTGNKKCETCGKWLVSGSPCQCLRPQDHPVTELARQWQGWGTALKPAIETVTVASKPLTEQQEQLIIQSNLFQLEAKLWLLLNAKLVEADLTSSRLDHEGAFRIAQWTAEKLINTQEDLCGRMDMSRFELATSTSLSIALSWRRILGEALSNGSMFTTETKLSTTIDWKTLSFSLSQITPESIIEACSLPGGFSANASIAEKHFNASLLLLQSIRTLSATDNAILQEQARHQEEGVKPSLDPCIMARKPLIGTVAENVLEHGTGGLNIDGCRVEANGDKLGGGHSSAGQQMSGGWERPWMKNSKAVEKNAERSKQAVAKAEALGRWPANFIHDGSDEVVSCFPDSKSCNSPSKARPEGTILGGARSQGAIYPGETGSAARFFYCAKASKKDRGDDNKHPTVKPTDLMRYLCRLVTPPNGLILDPFTGSGSTGKAAVLEGFRFVGIEREAEYIEIARARIEEAVRKSLAGIQKSLFD